MLTSVLPLDKNKHFALRQTKRKLSIYEKSSLPTTRGRALVLPGDPNTEIEELTAIGYNPCYIFGCESDEMIYHRLNHHYWDQTHLFYGDIGEFMRNARARGSYTYIHLDYCKQFGREVLDTTQFWSGLPGPLARVRVSASRARRLEEQFEWEEFLRSGLIERICELGIEYDTHNIERWVDFYDHFTKNAHDTAVTVAVVILFNFFLGIQDVRSFLNDEPHIPEANGTHRISSIQRFEYNEEGVSNYMFTVWADLAPFHTNSLRTSTQWILDEIAGVFSALAYRTPTFNPEIFK